MKTPARADLTIALAVVAVLAVSAGGLALVAHLTAENIAGAQLFLAGWFLAGLAAVLRKLQLIEWSLRLSATSPAPAPAPGPASAHRPAAAQSDLLPETH